jgi:hypothetical protein
MVEKSVRDGKVAVLYSPGYGAGWSTWNNGTKEVQQFALFDRGLVEMAERKASEDEVKAYIKSKLGGVYFCTLGWESIRIMWLNDDESFRVKVHDGYERIV